MATREQGNATTVALVLGGILILAFVAYQLGYVGNSPEETPIPVPKLSPTPIGTPVRTNPPATMTPPANQY